MLEGDIRQYFAIPPHKPNLLYIIGEKDRFGIHHTQDVFNYWYNTAGKINIWPNQLPEQKKWFIVVPGLEHPHSNNTSKALNLQNYTELKKLLITFFNTVQKDYYD